MFARGPELGGLQGGGRAGFPGQVERAGPRLAQAGGVKLRVTLKGAKPRRLAPASGVSLSELE